LVEIPINPSYHLHSDYLGGQASFYLPASYLCKSQPGSLWIAAMALAAAGAKYNRWITRKNK